MDLRLQHPFSMMVVGPSGSGKTQFTLSLLSNIPTIVNGAPNDVLWCYSIWQRSYESANFKTHKGLPSEETLCDLKNTVVVIDDMMDEDDTVISKLFTKYCHHFNISCIFITQNLFSKSRCSRNISLNSNYIVLMKSSRDRGQISCLARQVFPTNAKFMISSYEDATNAPFSYLLLDFTPTAHNSIRLRTGIFPHECLIAYVAAEYK